MCPLVQESEHSLSLIFSEFSYNSQSLFDMVNDLPDELLGPSDYPTGGGNDDVTSALGNKSDNALNKHVQLSALLQNTNQANPVPSRSPNVMNNNPLNSHRSPLSNSLSSPPHNNMVGKPVSAGNDLNFVSSSAVFMSNANSVSSMGTMANSNAMSSLGSHANVSSIPSSMAGFSMAQRNPMMPNGPQYAVSGQPGQGRGMGPGPQMPNLQPTGMMNINPQMRVNMGHPGLQQNVGNQPTQLLNVSIMSIRVLCVDAHCTCCVVDQAFTGVYSQ